MCAIDQINQHCRHLNLTSLLTALPELLQQAEDNELSYLHYTQLLLEHEVKQRHDKRIAMNRRKADFPVEKYLESFDYRHQTTITKRQVNQLLDFDFIDNRHNCFVWLNQTNGDSPNQLSQYFPVGRLFQ